MAKESGEPVVERPKRAPKASRPTDAPSPTDRPTREPTSSDVDRAFDGIVEMLEAGPIEAAARDALKEPSDAIERLRHELVFRGARSLDDPKNARYYASTVEAMRKVLADISGDGGDGDTSDIVEAIRRAGRGGDGPEVGDPS